MAEFVASSTLKFDTDFDFDSANAQFIKMMLEREMQDWLNRKGWWQCQVENACAGADLF
jgi:hypothetical protein